MNEPENYADLRDKEIHCSKCGVLFCWYEDDYLDEVCALCKEKCETRSSINKILAENAALRRELAASQAEAEAFRQRCIGYEIRLGLYKVVEDRGNE